MTSVLLSSLLLSVATTVTTNEVYDVRIHEGAEKGSRMTSGVGLQRRIENLRGCYGQLETDIDWMEYRPSRNAFYTTHEVPEQRNEQDMIGTLHLLCAGNQMHSFDFRLLISHRNHHPPTFDLKEYNVHVPISLHRAEIVTKLTVTDNDPVIYNSERELRFTQPQSLFSIRADGTIRLKQELTSEIPYKPLRMQVLAIDYGSPQLHSIVNLTITPVTVSAVRDLRANVATSQYQVIEWDSPEFGHADRFRLEVRAGDVIVHEEEVDGRTNRMLIRVPIHPAGNFSFRVVSSDVTGETPSEVKRFHVIQNDLSCAGECARGGGTPLCFYGPFSRMEQYVDSQGAHCRCFPGHTGISCDTIATCQPEETIEAHGGIDWPQVNTNITLRVKCPYNMDRDNQWIERGCVWDRASQRAVWDRSKEADKCKTQASVLTHLAMLGTFASNANSVSTIHTVARFIRDLLAVPAFSSNSSSPAHFDQKIAENVARVVDALLNMDVDALQGNTTVAKADLLEAVQSVASRLPLPFSLSSPDHGLQMKSIRWMKTAEAVDTALGTRCRIHLPKVDPEQSLRAVCMTNATLVDIVEQSNPVLSLSVDSNQPMHFSRFVILLKPRDHIENYTCVYYDTVEEGWSTRGIRRIDVSYHGYVRCETNHLGVFSLLPERLFHSESDSLRDLSIIIPTATTLIALICAVFLLFTAAIQRNRSIDLALLVFLFFVFLLHTSHLVMLIAPQVGDPFSLSPIVHIMQQFSLLSLSASLFLVLSSLHDVIVTREKPKTEEDVECCSTPCSVVFLSFVIPAILTIATYHYAEDYDNELARLVDRIDWVFLCAYLAPSVFFFSLVVAFAVWNIYLGNSTKSRHRGSAERFLALTPAIQASLTAIFIVILLIGVVVLFQFREHSVAAALLFSTSQVLYIAASFFFSGFLFRARDEAEHSVAGGSCHSLERKRDISRALLDHGDVSKHSDHGSSSQSDLYLHMSQSLYDRQPMVSIV